MEPRDEERRLTTILSADVVGYSRLMGVDEAGTLAALKAHRRELIEPKAAQYRGRTVKLMGDGALMEFASVVDAVRFAVEVQCAMRARNADVPEDRRILYRIGINIGDIIVEGDDLYGDGVNLAARLEAIATPGGVCVSGTVFDHVKGKADIDFADMGEQMVKNISEPVRVYSVALKAPTDRPEAGGEAGLTLPEKPSIAVLPFDNMSGDPEQEYFADGITEDIITGLSRFHTLFVIARNSTFVYKGQAVKVQEVGRDLGVQYVVEGSVRKSGRRVRVTAQLVEADSGKHAWADRYDRDLDDIFAVQDEITQAIVSTLPGRLDYAGWERAKRKQTANMTAYDYVLLGLERFNRFSREDNLQARRMFQTAIDFDGSYARAHALLASTHIWDLFIYAEESEQSLDEASRSAERALVLDDEDGWSCAMLGFAHFLRRQDEVAEIQLRRAVSLNPNDPDAFAFMANALTYFGQWEEALECIVKAKRINPFPPGYYHWYHGLALYSAREYEQAIMAIKHIQSLDRWHHGLLAMCYAQLDRLDEASAELAIFVDARRKEMRERGASAPVRDLDLVLERVNRYRVQADRAHFLEGLRKVGLSV